MKYYIVAGEASGDLHGSNLMKGLYREDPAANIRFWGGPMMDAVFKAHETGEGLVQDYRDGAVMGVVEVLRKAPALLKRVSRCKADIAAWKPDVVILIDYPGFNFKIAEFAHNAGFKVYYYIPPNLWATRDGRIQYLLAHEGEVLAAGGRAMNLVDLTDAYMTFFLPTNIVGKVRLGAEVKLIFDAAPDYPINASITFIDPVAQFTPKSVETKVEREKLMFRVKAHINAEKLRKYISNVKTGLPGVAWVKLDPEADWKDAPVKIPENKLTAVLKPDEEKPAAQPAAEKPAAPAAPAAK